MIDASKLTFEQWLAAKQAEEKQITHNAETVKDKMLYALEDAIIRICFDRKLPFMNLYFIPPALDRGSVALYGYQRIMISKPYYQEHGIDDNTISTMFHECVHAWDSIKGIKDTDQEYHNTAFKQTCEEHCGNAFFRNEIDGYNDAKPSTETMQKIKHFIHQYSSNRRLQIE